MYVQYPDRRVKRTKEKFKDVLLALMEKKNFHEITITEIVKAADFNRGTFYTHYQQKEDLLDEIIEEMFIKMAAAYRNPYLHLSVVDFNELPSHTIIFFDHFLENKRFYRLMLSPKTNYHFHEKLAKRLERLFREELELPITATNPNIDYSLFRTYRIHGIIGLILQWIENDFTETPSYMGDQLIHILGFYTPKIYVKIPKE